MVVTRFPRNEEYSYAGRLMTLIMLILVQPFALRESTFSDKSENVGLIPERKVEA